MKVNQLKAGAVLSYISLFAGTLISLIYTPYMLKALGQSEFGIYSLVNTVIAYFTLLDFGFGNAIIRYTAKYKAEGNKEKESAVHGMFLLLYSLIGLATLAIGAVIIVNTDKIFSSALTAAEVQKMKPLLALALFNIAISFPLSLFSSIINAYQRYIFIKSLFLIRTILNPLFMVSVLMLGYGSMGMIVVTTIVNLVFCAANIYYCLKKLSLKIRLAKIDKPLLKEISGYSFFIFLGIISDKFFWSTDQILLGINKNSNSSEIAIYALAATFISLFISLTSVIGQLQLPQFISMLAQKRTDEEISNKFIKISRVQFFICAYVFTGFIIVGKTFITTWAGSEYLNSFYVAAIIMASLVAGISQNVGIAVIQAKNLIKFRAYLQLSVATLNVILTWFFISYWGAVGAAISTFISHFLAIFIILSIYYQKKVKLNVAGLWKGLSRFFPLYIISAVLSLLFESIISKHLSGYSNVLCTAAFFSVLYFSSTYIMMNTGEKQLVVSLINRIFRRNARKRI
jgi:O-antigen/teichoic acid export membrane protein